MIMNNTWKGKHILIIGAARQGQALARYMVSQGAKVVLNDHRLKSEMKPEMEALSGLPIKWVFGSHSLELLNGVDCICPSAGIPLNLEIIKEARRRGIPLSNDSQIFLENAPCKVIGITGSAGKTTTTTLVGRMAQSALQSPRRTWVGGNIGQPLIAYLEQIHQSDLVIMEISSFQLDLMTLSPQVAGVLNITPNHLDRHGTLEAYTASKARILDFQQAEDVAVLGRDDPGGWNLKSHVKGRLFTFGIQPPLENHPGTFLNGEWCVYRNGEKQENLFRLNTLELRGEHNLSNTLAACAIAIAAGLPPESLESGIKGFRGVPHRLEFVRYLDGVAWYNDSIATAPERTMAAIRSFSEPLVVLLGGRDKNLPWEELAKLVCQRVDHVILFGEAADIIKASINKVRNSGRPFSMGKYAHLKEAILEARKVSKSGDVVLLAPGGTSFDEYRDFEERGEDFRKWVMQL